MIRGIHHIAIICSDYQRSKKYYTEVLGLQIIAETYRAERQSWKLDLAIGDSYCIELFSFPEPPKRSSHPEAAGLRHLAFRTDDVDAMHRYLQEKQQHPEPIRMDELTGKRFFFTEDPDGLPLEFYSA